MLKRYSNGLQHINFSWIMIQTNFLKSYETVSQIVKHRVSIWSRNFTRKYASRKIRTYVQPKKNHFYINAHNSIIIIIAPKWEQVKCPSTDNWINKMCYIHTMDYYSSIKRTDTCYTWVNLKTCYVKEASHKELHILHDSIYMKCAE